MDCVVKEEGPQRIEPKLLAIDVPPAVSLDQVATFLTEEGVEWEYADPKYEDLFPDDEGGAA